MPHEPGDISDDIFRVVLASGIGPVSFNALMNHFGSFESIANASATELGNCRLKRGNAARFRKAMDETDPENERQAMIEHQAQLILRGDPDYPILLNTIDRAPIALWVQGALQESDQLAVAMVGSRKCTSYGRDQAGRFGAMLAQSGLTIISGGARGIDGEAHRAAIRVNGRTVVVCGCGLANTYPPEHGDLFSRVADGHGAVLSEYPMQVGPQRQHFPQRNRIISGMSLGVLVIEAARGSGALITARAANEQSGREVMALPGPVDSPASLGCLQAIRDGWAALVLDHSDVLVQMESTAQSLLRGAIEFADPDAFTPQSANSIDPEPSLFELNLTPPQQAIVDALQNSKGSVVIDDLPALTQLPMSSIMAALTILQIRNIVSRSDAKIKLSRKANAEVS